MICVIDCGTEWLGEILEQVEKGGREVEVVKIGEMGGVSFDRYSGIVISGASILLTEVDLDEFLKDFGFLRTTEVPVLGICLGHQIMGAIYGAQVLKYEMVDKKEAIEIVFDSCLMGGIENRSSFLEEHSEYITLPEDFVLVGKSASCANEVMQHKSKKLFGVQFHPEVSGEVGGRLMGNFLGEV